MMAINREQLQRMIEKNAVTIVVVLDSRSFEEFRLPRAPNLPLHANFDRDIQAVIPDKSQPVAVHSKDEDDNALSRVAKWMAGLGNKRVYHYEAGKTDWKDASPTIESQA